MSLLVEQNLLNQQMEALQRNQMYFAHNQSQNHLKSNFSQTVNNKEVIHTEAQMNRANESDTAKASSKLQSDKKVAEKMEQSL